MTTDIQFLSKAINAWDSISNNQKSIMLIGNSHTGRTTFAELINKYQYRIMNQSLVFQKDKYLLQNVISTKAIKVQTVVPNAYKYDIIKSTQKSKDLEDNISIIDVPSYWLSPQLKKWGPFEQKVTINLMFQKTRSVGFLLFIDQKYTRANPTTWIKTLIGFLEIFKQHPAQLLNSVGWVITRCANDVTDEAISKRLGQLKTYIKKDKLFNSEVIDLLFKNIIDNSRFYIFRKFSGNQKAQYDQLTNIYKNLPKISNYEFNRNNMKVQNWSADQQKYLKEYVSKCDYNFSKIINFISEFMNSSRWTVQILNQNKKNYDFQMPNGISISEEIKQKFKDKSSSWDIPQLIHAYKQLRQQLHNSLQENKLIDYLIKFPFFFKEEQDYIKFQVIQQALNFKENQKIPFDFVQTSKSLERLYPKDQTNLYNTLQQHASQFETQAFYQACIQIIQSDSNILDEKTKKFLQDCKTNVLKFRNSKQLLTKTARDLESMQDQKKIAESVLKIANAFYKQGYFRQASRLFRLIKFPGDAIACMQCFENESEREAEQYINYLTQVYLFDSAKRACYSKTSKFSRNKIVFGQILKRVIQVEKNYQNSGLKNNVLLQEVNIEGKEVKRIIEQAISVSNQMNC